MEKPVITPHPIKALLDEVQKSLGTASFAEGTIGDPDLIIFILKRIHFETGAILAAMGAPVGENDISARLAEAEKDAILYKMIWEKHYSQYAAIWDCWRNSKTNDEIAQTLYSILHGWSSGV